MKSAFARMLLVTTPFLWSFFACAQEGRVLCSPAVTSSKCKAFNDAFFLWSGANSLKNVEIVVTDRAGVASEKKKVTAKVEAIQRFAKTPGDLNRASILVGAGAFDAETVLLERDGVLITKVVLSDEVPMETSDQLMFFIFGYAEGALRGMGNTVK
jgi:hypothetical protein